MPQRPTGAFRRLAVASAALVLAGSTGCAGLLSRDESALERERRQLHARRESALAEQARKPEKPTLMGKVEEADRLQRSGDLEAAMWTYLHAYRLDPENPLPRERIGYLQLTREPERAAGIFAEVVKEDPESAQAHAGLGLARLALGQVDAAVASLERARELDADSPSTLAALGAAYDRQERHVEAREQLERAVALRPGDARLRNNLGVSYMLSADFEHAAESFRHAAALDPRDAVARNNLGLALGRLGRYDAALDVFRQSGDEQAAQNNLGYVYYLNERYEEAVAHYERALLAEGDEDRTVLRNLNAALDSREGERP